MCLWLDTLTVLNISIYVREAIRTSSSTGIQAFKGTRHPAEPTTLHRSNAMDARQVARNSIHSLSTLSRLVGDPLHHVLFAFSQSPDLVKHLCLSLALFHAKIVPNRRWEQRNREWFVVFRSQDFIWPLSA